MLSDIAAWHATLAEYYAHDADAVQAKVHLNEQAKQQVAEQTATAAWQRNPKDHVAARRARDAQVAARKAKRLADACLAPHDYRAMVTHFLTHAQVLAVEAGTSVDDAVKSAFRHLLAIGDEELERVVRAHPTFRNLLSGLSV